MRFKSSRTDGYLAFAVTGTNTISFAIDASKANTKGLLGFAIQRKDFVENEERFMTGFKVFKKLVPEPDLDAPLSTFEHPVQSFVWDDFSAKPAYRYEYRFFPVTGEPGKLSISKKPVKIKVETEPLFSDGEHDVFFNRGAISGRAYALKFGKLNPHALKATNPQKAEEALQWLSRDLDDAMLRFIGSAKKGDTLHCCFYEFSYLPILEALKAAIDTGVDVQIILDRKGDGFPGSESKVKCKEAGIPVSRVTERKANPKDIMHNKFMVLLRGTPKKPKEVWTGSTNVSFGGIHGHTNVGHWLRNEAAAAKFEEYWDLLQADPGGKEKDDKKEQEEKLAALQKQVEAISPQVGPEGLAKLPKGVTPQFSPMSKLSSLELYAEMLKKAKHFGCVTFPFGINKAMSKVFLEKIENSPLVFMLFDEQPDPKELPIEGMNNVYPFWGVDVDEELAILMKDASLNIKLNLNRHAKFVHTKILLMDPLSDDPIVVTGSANFSNNSVQRNDENMLLIRGNQRAADIYFTEFNRVVNFFYLGMAIHNLKEKDQKGASIFLDPTDGWLGKYEAGSMRFKRVQAFVNMKGAKKG